MIFNSGLNKRNFNYYYKVTIENEVTGENEAAINQLLNLLKGYVYQSLREFKSGKKMNLTYSTHYFFRETLEKGFYNFECDIIDFTPDKVAIEAYLYSEIHSKLMIKWFSVYERKVSKKV
jgi:DNA-binding transcriptional regulator WhiA